MQELLKHVPRARGKVQEVVHLDFVVAKDFAQDGIPLVDLKLSEVSLSLSLVLGISIPDDLSLQLLYLDFDQRCELRVQLEDLLA